MHEYVVIYIRMHKKSSGPLPKPPATYTNSYHSYKLASSAQLRNGIGWAVDEKYPE